MSAATLTFANKRSVSESKLSRLRRPRIAQPIREAAVRSDYSSIMRANDDTTNLRSDMHVGRKPELRLFESQSTAKGSVKRVEVGKKSSFRQRLELGSND